MAVSTARMALAGAAAARPTVARSVARGFATEKQILLRINATSNLKKITSSMKMVSAAKLKGDTNRLLAARPFNKWSEKLGTTQQSIEEIDTSSFPQKNLFVAFSSDRGLCGGVNSFVTRGMKKVAAELSASGKEFKLIVLGEKGRGQMRRIFSDNMVSAHTELEYPANFHLVASIANEVSKVDPSEYEAIHLVYNEFVSAIAYTPTVRTLVSLAGEGVNEPLVDYEFEPDTKSEVLADIREYLLASEITVALAENSTSEQSSRTQAMENASKNAGELIDSLTLQYNKARQARITTELIEIISGASALD